MLKQPSAKQQFVVVREVAASADKVFRALISEDGMKAWAPPLCRSARWQHPPGASTPGVGSVRHLSFAGGLVAQERVVLWVPGRQLNYCFDPSAIALPFTTLTRNYEGVTRIDPIDPQRSRLSWASHFDMPGRLAPLEPVVRAGLRPLISLLVARLARLAESEQT